MGLITKDNRTEWIKRMARHYGKSVEQIEESVSEDPERLEGFAEYITNDCADAGRSHRNYGRNYYE